MWEKRTAARWLPVQVCAHRCAVTGEQLKAGFFGEMFGSRGAKLLGGGKMHETILDICQRTGASPIILQLHPFLAPQYFINQHDAEMPLLLTVVKGQIS